MEEKAIDTALTTTAAADSGPSVEKIRAHLEKRFRDAKPVYSKQEYDAQPLAKFYPWEVFATYQTDAVAVVQVERENEFKARIKLKLEQGKQQLIDEDTSVIIPVAHIDGMEKAIRLLVSDSDLNDYNAILRKAGSGPLTFRDVAFIACIHRESVLNNGKDNPRYLATSPFKRIARAAVSFKFREKPFDNRQIRAALNMLSAVEFTGECVKSEHRTGEFAKESLAGKWALSDNPFWTQIFA